PAPPAPSWLNDVSRAAQYLTTLTLQSAAEAALLMRGQQLIAYAGQFGREQAEELSRIVADAWAKDGGGGSGAQVRFIRLSTGADFLVYSTLAAADIVLSMAFQAETPLGMIRKQAKQATEAIFRVPATGNTPAAEAAPPPAPLVDTFTSDPPPEPAPTASPEDWAPLAARPAAPSDAAPMAPMPPAAPSPVVPTSPSPHALLGMPAAFPNARRTPHGLYALSYTYLIIPKFASTRLSGDLQSRLAEWISFQALTHDWRITGLHIEPDHLEISLDCAPSEAPEKVVKAIMQYTAEKVMAEFPRLAAEHSKRVSSFWAQGYYVVAPGRRLSADEIRAFIDYQRQEQNG
ncbi:MAG: IS200/IS605 family transposase, partial [Chloroflexi bacterium]|nr:IS200/IS605 family transposase [Chloroflexota bacterium]